MTASLPVLATVLEAGLALPQDLGRPGRQRLGIAAAGAWDRRAYRVLALLLGHEDPVLGPPGPAAIELLGGSLAVRVETAVRAAVVGPCSIALDGTPMPPGCVFEAPRGSVVRVDGAGRGPAYACFDGWQPGLVLGSASHDTFSKVGPPALAAGMVLAGEPRMLSGAGAFHRPLREAAGPIRVIPGPGGAPVEGAWTASAVARSGLRLAGRAVSGDRFSPARAAGQPSNPVLRGLVQAPDDGELIILGTDGAVTGGYEVAGVVASCDLDRLSAVPAGTELQLARAGRDECRAEYEAAEAWLRTCIVHPGRLY